MHILLLQLYSAKPTPAYRKIATGLRELGHVVWLGSPNVESSVEWHDGTAVIATQTAQASSLSGSVGRRLTKLDLFRRVRRFILDTNPDIVQINSYNIFRMMPLGMPGHIHFILDMRQINELYGDGIAGRLVATIRNKSRVLDSRLLYDQTTFLHEAGAQKVLGDNWRRWSSVIPMGVEPQFLAVVQQPAHSFGGPVKFIYSGRLVRIRRLERIIQAAALVRRQTDQFRIIFIGHDGADGFYQEMIRRLEVEDVVCLRPPVPYERVPEAISGYDVALAYVPELPLDWQYHPTLKILEYRALGLPIIASDFTPNRELVEHGGNGLLVQNTAQSIADALLRYIGDPIFLRSSWEKAQAARCGITWADVAQQYQDLYYQLAETHKNPGA